MKRFIALIVSALLLFLCAAPALAANFYIIPDSNTRRLTREELWTWQYDALGYAFNEIFARHGYHFNPGGRYDNYFRSQTWYYENPMYDNQGIHKNLMTNIEWYNERLIKEVREEMRALNTTNSNGKALSDIKYEPEIYGAFSQFQPVYFAPNQKLPVYSGPGTHYHRSANGKALASTNGHIYVGGWENGWLQIMYWTNDYNVRVGYTQSSNFKDKIDVPHLRFEYAPATITRRTALTDDPVASFQPMATLESGTQVTYLADAYNEKHWAYVEVTVGGTMMRGYIDADAVNLLSMQADEPSLAPAEVVAEIRTQGVASNPFEPKVGASAAKETIIEHSLWGLSASSSIDDVYATLREKGIQYEVENQKNNITYITSQEGQSITMFGIPVEIRIRFDGGSKNHLVFVAIDSDDEWEPQGSDPGNDADIQEAIEVHKVILQAIEGQYGTATGGYLQTEGKEDGALWSYASKDGRPDYETVLLALENDNYADLHTFYNNLELRLAFSYVASPPWAYVGFTYYYNLDRDGYIWPYSADVFSFDLPSGPFTTKPQSIEIGF